MPKRRKTKKVPRKQKRTYEIVSAALILAGVFAAIILLLNVPIVTTSCTGLDVSITQYRNLSVTLYRVGFHPESQYIKSNISYVRIEAIVGGESRSLATVPFKPGRTINLNSSVTYNVTDQTLPIALFVRDNVSHIKYPLALISSPKRAYLPLTTYLYRAIFEVHIVNYGALITLTAEAPVLLHVKLYHAGNVSSSKMIGPLIGSNKIYINESFNYIKVEPLVVRGFLYFRVLNGTAVLYPSDNTAFFAVLCTSLIATGLIILAYGRLKRK